nr:hypothetical protein [uncultured Undibacterium sp.]
MSFERVELPGQVLTSVESMAVRAKKKGNINFGMHRLSSIIEEAV